jgi:predicted XRE-type DNA-binding protein
MKARPTFQIYRVIRERNLVQVQAAKALGIDLPHVSLLMATAPAASQPAAPWNS